MAIFPLNLNSGGHEGSHIGTVTASVTGEDLLHYDNRAERRQDEVLVPSENISDSLDDVSTIDLVSTESNEYSLQGQPRSNKTLTLSTTTSAGNSGKSSQNGSQDSLGDYRQNFPYEPPRLRDTYPDRPHCTRLMRTIQPTTGGKRIKDSTL